MSDKKSGRKLVIHKETLSSLRLRTGVRAGTGDSESTNTLACPSLYVICRKTPLPK